MLYSEAVRGSQICMQTDLCSGSVKKKESFFWVYFYRKVFLFRSDSEDSFRVRSSSICLDLRLDLSIILFTIFR